jgi:hypothetical protein
MVREEWPPRKLPLSSQTISTGALIGGGARGRKLKDLVEERLQMVLKLRGKHASLALRN